MFFQIRSRTQKRTDDGHDARRVAVGKGVGEFLRIRLQCGFEDEILHIVIEATETADDVITVEDLGDCAVGGGCQGVNLCGRVDPVVVGEVCCVFAAEGEVDVCRGTLVHAGVGGHVHSCALGGKLKPSGDTHVHWIDKLRVRHKWTQIAGGVVRDVEVFVHEERILEGSAWLEAQWRNAGVFSKHACITDVDGLPQHTPKIVAAVEVTVDIAWTGRCPVALGGNGFASCDDTRG